MLTQIPPPHVKNTRGEMQSNENTALSGGGQGTVIDSF